MIFLFQILSIVSMDIDKLFGEEQLEDIKEKNKKKEFFINQYSHEKKLMQKVYKKDETYTSFQQSNGIRKANTIITEENNQSPSQGGQVQGSLTIQRQNVLTETSIHKKETGEMQNDGSEKKDNIQEKKKHTLEEIETLAFEKVKKKEFLNKVNTFGKFLEVFINLEKNFAKDLRTIGKPRFLKTCMFDVVVRRDERYHHSYRLCDIDPIYREEYNTILVLNESISRQSDSQLIILPNWIYLKNLFLEMSKVHDQLVQYIQFGIFDLTKVLIEEYEEQYKKLKLMKKEAQAHIQKKLEEAKQQELVYNEISKKIKNMAETYEVNQSFLMQKLNFYILINIQNQQSNQKKELARKRVELKGEIELLLYDKNNSKIKVYASYEALHKARQDANKVNSKILSHKKDWEKRFQTLFKTSMKSIISGFFDITKDVQKNLKSLLITNLKQSTTVPVIDFDAQSFENGESAYSSVDGSFSNKKNKVVNQTNVKGTNNISQQNESGLLNTNIGLTNRSVLNNSTINPLLICVDHRQQLTEFLKNQDKYDKEYDEIEKYQEEITFLVEDVCSSLSKYIYEFENKISKTNTFKFMGEAMIYEQMGSFLQIDISDNTKRYFKIMTAHFEKNLKPFQSNTQRVLQDLAIEKKNYKKHISTVQDLQINLDKTCANWQQNRDSIVNFQQKYDFLKHKFDEIYEKTYNSKQEIEKIIKQHEKGVEELKKQIINAIVQFSVQFSERFELIENNSDIILSQDDDNMEANFSDKDSVHSKVSTSSLRNNNNFMKRSSIAFLGQSEFLHQYQQDDEVNEAGSNNLNPASIQDSHNKSAAKIVTKLLKVFYQQWKDADFFKEKIKTELYISLNKKLEDSLEEMVVTKLIIKGEGPDIKSITPQKSEDYEFLVDLELSYKGTVYIEVDTAYHLDWPKPDSYKLPLTVKIKLNEFYSIIRLCYVPREYGKSWFSFIGEPVLSIDIDPIISKKYHVSRLPRVILQEIISQKIKKMTFPNRDSIKIPLSKPDKKITDIREKLLHKKQSIIARAPTNKSSIYTNPYKDTNQ
ncbi:hypothetical protein ABPG74_016045 [Tetrahymena malaccensis]